MSHVGGQLQAQFMTRVRGRDPQRCLVVPVDVGKSTASALVADHYGELVVEPFEFALTEWGFDCLATDIARAEEERTAEVVRVGVEAAGHYHRTLVARLRAGSYEVLPRSPNPSAFDAAHVRCRRSPRTGRQRWDELFAQ